LLPSRGAGFAHAESTVVYRRRGRVVGRTAPVCRGSLSGGVASRRPAGSGVRDVPELNDNRDGQ
jgi:hypothetical protein